MILFEPSPGFCEIWRARLPEPVRDDVRHLMPIWRALAYDDIAFATVVQNEGRFIVPETRPVLMLIGDDLHEAKGPRAFSARSLRAFLPRCAGIAFMGGEAHPGIYAEAARRVGKDRQTIAIIESQPEQAEAWVALVDKMAPKAHLLICLPHPKEVRD